MAGLASKRFIEAFAFATDAHGDVQQERKGTDFPYIVHPARVAEILDRFGCSDDLVVAGLLHDTLEDTRVTAQEITAVFGARVSALVEAVSEHDKSLAWKERKQQTLERLEGEDDPEVLALVAADKLDNVRSIAETLRHDGEKETWKRFNVERSEQHRYYRRIAEILLSFDPESRLFRTLDFETQTLFPDRRRTTSFLAGKPFGNPHDARAYLADPIKHWRPNHSAMELATSWVAAGGIPSTVAAVLATCETYAGCRLIEGLFEREVDLGTRGRPSQTDLLALVALADGYGVIAVEGKYRETFGPLVSDWNRSKAKGKQARFESLCSALGLDPATADGLRYQLLHRSVSALLEADRYGACEALMLVHSFDPADSSLDDYRAFAAALGLTGAQPNAITSPTRLGSVTLRLGWVRQLTAAADR